jgi:hypothetical protein
MTEFENVFIFVADSLRYDYVPESIAEEGKVINTLAPSLHTPVSFASLVTGKSPEKHSVRGFNDTLSSHHKTIFDFFENGSFYDNELDPVRNTVLKNTPEAKELEEIEPPFVYIERAMDTHIPYGEMGHGNELLAHQKEASDEARNRDVRKNYKKGVRSVEKHFWSHIETLKDRNLKEDTLIIFTSDHGEFLGERVNLRKRYAHAHPMHEELVEVPTVFLNKDINSESARFIDLVETSLKSTKNKSLNSDSVDLRRETPKKGKSLIDGYTSFNTDWKFENKWKPTNGRINLNLSVAREDLRMILSKFDRDHLIPRPGDTSKISDLDI